VNGDHNIAKTNRRSPIIPSAYAIRSPPQSDEVFGIDTIPACKPPNPNFIEVTKQFLMSMPIAQYLGFEITDVAPGLFEITQPFRRELSVREGTFQAGPIGTLADMAAACAGATPDGWQTSTIDYTLKLLAPAIGEKLVARGRVLIRTYAVRSRRRCFLRAKWPRDALRHRAHDHTQLRIVAGASRLEKPWIKIFCTARSSYRQ
jgi:acyl-coenzyme A thioesterase PaaI-like protein